MKLKKVQKVYQAENRINDLSEIENGNFETVPEKESVLHNFINTKDGIKIVISDSLRNIKKVDYETGKEVVISANGQIVKDHINQGTSNNYTYGFNKPKLDKGKFDKKLHGLSDVVNYISEGTGVQDETPTLERIDMSILGWLVSANYDGLKNWSDTKNYKTIGYREVLEYLIQKRRSKLLDKIKDGGINK